MFKGIVSILAIY